MKQNGLGRLFSYFSRAGDAWAIFLLAIWHSLFFWRVALGQRIFAGDDLATLFMPAGYELGHALAEGRLPLWTPDLQAGFPIFAEGHIAALYPPNLLLYRLLPTPLALSYLLLFHLAWLGIGGYVFTRLSGLRIPSALLMGFSLSFGGFALAHIQHYTLLATAAWLPWLLSCQVLYQRALQVNRKRFLLWFLAAALIVGLEFLSGFPQVALINLGVFILTGTLAPLLWERPAGVKLTRGLTVTTAFRSLGITILCIISGVGVSAVQWLPASELLALSVRSGGLDASFLTSFSMEPAALAQFIFPFWQSGMPALPNMEYFAYLGFLPFLLFLVAPVLRRDARTFFFFLASLFFLSLALGGNNPLYGLLSYVPVFNRFRVPARFIFPFGLAAIFLAATAFDVLLNRLREPDGVSRAAVACLVVSVVLILGLMIGSGAQPLGFWSQAWMILPWLFGAAAVTILLLALTRRLDRNEFAVAVLTLSVLDLTLFAQPFSLTLDGLISSTDLFQPPLSIRSLDFSDPFARLLTNVYNDTLRPNRTVLYNIPSAQLSSPLDLGRYDDYGASLSPATFNLLGVRYLVQPVGPFPADYYNPTASIVFDLFEGKTEIPATRAVQVQVTSFTDKTGDLQDGSVVGHIALSSSNHDPVVLPIRIGVETADWAYEGLAAQSMIKHSKPVSAISFPGYLISVGHSFNGFKYVARYNLPAPLDITAVSADTNLADGQLVIERVVFLDEKGQSISLAPLAHRSDLSVAFRSHAVMVLENPDTLPRAFLVHAADILDDGQILARMQKPGFRPDQLALLSEGQPLHQTADNQNPAADAAAITVYEPERVVINAKTDKPGYLILADNYYPGWEATVDAQKVPVYRADYTFRAVPISAGEHRVVFEFRPALFVWGAIISGVTLFVVGILAVIGVRNGALPHRI